MPLPVVYLLQIAIAAVIGVSVLYLCLYIVSSVADVPQPDFMYKAIQETGGEKQAERTVPVLIFSKLVRRPIIRDTTVPVGDINEPDDSVKLPVEEVGSGATVGRVYY